MDMYGRMRRRLQLAVMHACSRHVAQRAVLVHRSGAASRRSLASPPALLPAGLRPASPPWLCCWSKMRAAMRGLVGWWLCSALGGNHASSPGPSAQPALAQPPQAVPHDVGLIRC